MTRAQLATAAGRVSRMHRQDRERGDQAVAGGAVVEEDDVAGLLAAEVVAAAHASPRRRSGRRPACVTSAMPSSRSASSRPRLLITVATTRVAWRAGPAALQLARRDRQHLRRRRRPRRARRRGCTRSASPSSAMPTWAPLARAPRAAGACGCSGAAVVVDVLAVGLARRCAMTVGAELREHLGRDPVGGAVGAVDDDPSGRRASAGAGRCS